MTRAFGWLPCALCMLLLCRGAWASSPFDDVIKTELGLPPGPLLCVRCHSSLLGGLDTIDKPFGLRARQLGLKQQDVQKLKEVLQQMEAANDDSDCDGVGDIAELRKGSDPNSGETDAGCQDALEVARYGCYCSTPARSTKPAWRFGDAAFASTALLAVLLVARRSRGATRSRHAAAVRV